MTSFQYQAAVVVGRWQLAHLGHLALFKEALSLAPKVLIVVGSAFRAREPRNPFNWQERVAQIEAMLSPEELARIEFIPVRDYFDHERWNRAVRQAVADKLTTHSGVVIVGHKKDDTSYYLDHFPEWRLHQITSFGDISATDLRNVLFGTNDLNAALTVLKPYLHPATHAWVAAWGRLPHIEARRKEHAAIDAYHERYDADAYITVDGLLRIGDYVLLIRRGKEFGYGLWAMPGGFLNRGERTLDGMLRELVEETKLGMLPATLRRAVVDKEVFEDPNRSPRARLFSHAYYMRMGAMSQLPEVEGKDDALEAAWKHIDELAAMEDQFFEDHFLGLDRFLKLLPA